MPFRVALVAEFILCLRQDNPASPSHRLDAIRIGGNRLIIDGALQTPIPLSVFGQAEGDEPNGRLRSSRKAGSVFRPEHLLWETASLRDLWPRKHPELSSSVFVTRRSIA